MLRPHGQAVPHRPSSALNPETLNATRACVRVCLRACAVAAAPTTAVIFNDVTTGEAPRLDYTAMAATRYGGLPLTSVDNISLSLSQYLYPDIDRRGNVFNMLHNDYGTDARNLACGPFKRRSNVLTTGRGRTA